MWEIYNEARISKKAEMKRKFNRDQKRYPLSFRHPAKFFNILDKRYGNEQLVISCHMNNLVKLDPIFQPSVKEMRKCRIP